MEPYSFSFLPPWDALRTLEGDEKSVELLELLLAHTTNPLHRGQFAPGHVTATGLVLHPDGLRMAMVFHARLERWLLPGGHVEKMDSTIYASAAREVLEETGLSVQVGTIVGVDVHGIPPKIRDGIKVEPYHQHHDILIGFETDQTELVLSEESRALCWVAPAEFDSYAVPPNIRRAYARWTAAFARKSSA